MNSYNLHTWHNWAYSITDIITKWNRHRVIPTPYALHQSFQLFTFRVSVFSSPTLVIPNTGLGESRASVFISTTNMRLPEHVLVLDKVNYRDHAQIAGCMTKLNWHAWCRKVTYVTSDCRRMTNTYMWNAHFSVILRYKHHIIGSEWHCAFLHTNTKHAAMQMDNSPDIWAAK